MRDELLSSVGLGLCLGQAYHWREVKGEGKLHVCSSVYAVPGAMRGAWG